MKILNSVFIPVFSGKISKTDSKPEDTAPILRKIEAVTVKPVQWTFVQANLPRRTVADNIEFEPAKTIEEAEKFANDSLGISLFRLTDLDCANYVNEALARNYNSSSDKSVIISTCSPSFSHLASITGEHLEFRQRIAEIIKELQESREDRKGFQYLFREDLDKICDLSESQKKYLNYFKNNIYDELPLKEKIGYCMFLRGFGRDEIPLTDSGKLALPDGGDFWIINHEIGHARHKKNIGVNEYNKLKSAFSIKDSSESDLIKKFSSIEPGWKSTLKISDYATQSPVEFVAEAYACLSNGVKFDDDAMKLYEKYGGPKIA